MNEYLAVAAIHWSCLVRFVRLRWTNRTKKKTSTILLRFFHKFYSREKKCAIENNNIRSSAICKQRVQNKINWPREKEREREGDNDQTHSVKSEWVFNWWLGAERRLLNSSEMPLRWYWFQWIQRNKLRMNETRDTTCKYWRLNWHSKFDVEWFEMGCDILSSVKSVLCMAADKKSYHNLHDETIRMYLRCFWIRMATNGCGCVRVRVSVTLCLRYDAC